MTPTPEETAASMQLVSEAIRQVADQQRTSIERLETKATIILGFVATAVPIYATQHSQLTLRFFAFTAYAVAAVAGLAATFPYQHEESPPPSKFGRAFVAKPQPPASVAKWLVKARVDAYKLNERKALRKAGLTWVSLLAFVAAAALSVWSVLA